MSKCVRESSKRRCWFTVDMSVNTHTKSTTATVLVRCVNIGERNPLP